MRLAYDNIVWSKWWLNRDQSTCYKNPKAYYNISQQ